MLPPPPLQDPPLLAYHYVLAIAFFVASTAAVAAPHGFIAGNVVSSSNSTLMMNGSTTCLSNIDGEPASPAAESESTIRRARLRGWSTISCNKESINVQLQAQLYNESTDPKAGKRHLFERRILNTECTDRDIGISQSREESSGGVPQFIVEIYTTCANNCEPSDVHLNCEWFASKMVVNPSIFKRIAFNDCLVNGGQPIPRGHILHFTYENSFMYSLSFKSARFC